MVFKGAVSRYSVIFCAFFARAKNGGCSRKCREHQIWKLGRPRGLAAGCWHDSAACEPTTSRARVALLEAFTCRRRQAALLFSGYEARARWYPLLQNSRLAATAISISILYRVFGPARPPKLASAISSPRAWVTGRRNRQCGRGSLSSDIDDVCHCEGKCAERGTSSRNGCRRSCQHRLCCGIRTVRDKDLKTQETHLCEVVVSCGDVQLGDRGRLKETLRALACRRFSFSLPEGALLSTAHPAVHLEMRRWYA